MRLGRSQMSAILVTLLFLFCRSSAVGAGAYRLQGHLPLKNLAKARHLGRAAASKKMQLTFALKPRDMKGLEDLLSRLYDPNSPDFAHYLSSSQFRDRFAPTDADVTTLIDELQASGLKVKQVQDNNLLISAEAETSIIESAFQIEIHDHIAADGRRVFSPQTNPAVSDAMRSRLSAVVGLDNFARYRTHRLTKLKKLDPQAASPNATSISSYMTPAKIKSAYGLSTSPTAGAGQIVALFQLDGYRQSDITAYANYFSITVPPLQNVLVDGFSGSAGADTDEVVLDIELVMGVSPGVSKIMVYEGPNTESGVLHTYNRIASDNIAKVVSSSWGSSEDGNTASFLNAENTIFQQMAAQGQSIFVASGDNGAYDNSALPTTLEVDDPASQPWVTAVGGTTISLNGSNAYVSETSWGSGSLGGGGGVSSIWSQPSWQTGLASAENKGSNLKRMLPDVSLNANPGTGYPIYSQGGWYAFGGTSAAAPIWAAFAAQVNQARAANSLSPLGFANLALYQIGQSSLRGTSFNDIDDKSTNLFYPAVTGYDLSTGLGTIKGPGLLAALSASALPPYPPETVNTTSGAGSVQISWPEATGATSYTVMRSSSSNGTYTALAINVADKVDCNSAKLSASSCFSYTDSVTSGSYFYYVIANNSAGSSSASLKKAGAPNLAPPEAPSGLSAKVIK